MATKTESLAGLITPLATIEHGCWTYVVWDLFDTPSGLALAEWKENTGAESVSMSDGELAGTAVSAACVNGDEIVFRVRS